MYKGRLFTFGCSFTSYHWPTWADILGREYDYFENWGRSGGSNQFIFNSLIEANARNKFTSQDTIAIMWTNVSRLDIYKDKNWYLPGNIYTTSVYNKEFLNNFTDYRGFLIRDFAIISATFDLLKYWNVQSLNFSMVPLHSDSIKQNWTILKETDVLELYKISEKVRPSVLEKIFNFDWHIVRDEPPLEFYDTHPRPKEHLKYLDAVLPEISISENTRAWVNDYRYWENKTFPNYPKIRL